MHNTEKIQPDWYESLSRFGNMHTILSDIDGRRFHRITRFSLYLKNIIKPYDKVKHPKRKWTKSRCIYYTYFTKLRGGLVKAAFSNTVETPSS